MSYFRNRIDADFPHLVGQSLPLMADGDECFHGDGNDDYTESLGFSYMRSPAYSPNVNILDYWAWQKVMDLFHADMTQSQEAMAETFTATEVLQQIARVTEGLKAIDVRNMQRQMVPRLQAMVAAEGGVTRN